jgi:ABC-2 type transport system ATP-binding protein
MSDAAIEVRGFQKTFYVGLRRKPSQAVKDISFDVRRGEIFGFLGPNGSGKTTTIKALLGLIRPDTGTLAVLGAPVTSFEWRSKIGYLPEHPTFYDYLSGFELVTWFGGLTGMTRLDAERAAKRQLERVGLGHAMHRRLRSYSKGMLQRAGLAQCLLGSPSLLILDEPMTGLDPIGRKDVRELLLELRSEGRTIFYSTHILPDVEMTCDRVAIISKGTVRRVGVLTDILKETTRGVSVVFSCPDPAMAEAVARQHAGSVGEGGAVQVECKDPETARALVGEMLAAGARLDKFEPHRDDLESIFLRSLGDDAKALAAANE